MVHLSRRSFLSIAGGLPLAFAMRRYGFADPPTSRVRYECRTPQGIGMLQIYAAGVQAMKNLPTSDPRSWIFQWYTHQVTRQTNKAAAIAATFPNAGDPNRALAELMWNTCQAHNAGDDENQFLPWHRCFLLFFEQIIGSLTGHTEFTLPYWNYSTNDPTVRGVIPPQFTMQNDATFKSLYDDLRYPSVNNGQPIQNSPAAPLGPGDPLSLDFLRESNYKPSPDNVIQGFNLDLDANLHGNVHTLVGGPQDMGAIPEAAQDPIFWMHHCNVDRLWASWSAAGGVTPPDVSQNFTFVDGSGTRQDVDTKNFLDTSALGQMSYSYDRLEPVPVTPAPTPSGPSLLLAANGPQPLRLTAAAQQAMLEPSAAAQPGPFAEHIAKHVPTKRVFLVLRELSADAQPGVLYNAYVDLPANPTRQQLSDHFVGIVNFFAFAHGGAGHAMAMPQKRKAGVTEKFLSFDVTTKIRAMQLNKSLQEKPTITLVPLGTPAPNANPVIGKVQILVQ